MSSFFLHESMISISTHSISKNMIAIPNFSRIFCFLTQHNTFYCLFSATQHYYSLNFHSIILLGSYFYVILILPKIFFLTLEMKSIVGNLFTLIAILSTIELLAIFFTFETDLFIFSLAK